MTFKQYGEALKALIELVYKGTVAYDPADTAFMYAQNATKNNIKFPFISFYHEPTFILDVKKISVGGVTRGKLFEQKAVTRNEDLSIAGVNEKQSKSVQNLYITMRYIFDIWGTDRESTERLTIELLFWLYFNRTVQTKYLNNTFSFTFEVDPNVVDNTDLVQYPQGGKMYRYSLSAKVDCVLLRSTLAYNILNPQIEITTETE